MSPSHVKVQVLLAHTVFTLAPVNHMYNDKKRVTVRQTVTPRQRKNIQIQKQQVQPLAGHR